MMKKKIESKETPQRDVFLLRVGSELDILILWLLTEAHNTIQLGRIQKQPILNDW